MLITVTRVGSGNPARLSVLHITGFETVSGNTSISFTDGTSMQVTESLTDVETAIEAAAVQNVKIIP